MWKYQSKSLFISLCIAFVTGFVFMYISLSMNMDIYASLLPEQVLEYVYANKVMTYIYSGFIFAGIVNVIRLSQLAMNQWNISPFIFLLLMFVFPDWVVLIGALLVIPVVIACIYGMISLRRQQSGQFTTKHFQNDDEFVRIYTMHYPLQEKVKPIADECKKNRYLVNLVYVLGIIAILCTTFLVNNLMIMFVLLGVYFFAFQYIVRYRHDLTIPMLSLLYDQCDPQACASALIYYSKQGRHYHLQQRTVLAQCLIYMDEPEMAQDVMVAYARKDRPSNLLYWSIMSYIYYLLKDETSLERCKEEIENIRIGRASAGVIVLDKELKAVNNKINLMNGELNQCKKYYLEATRGAVFPYQSVDASYYIGLISFVQQDYMVAKFYFERVVALGNKMSFVQKAKKYLDKLNEMDLDETISDEG